MRQETPSGTFRKKPFLLILPPRLPTPIPPIVACVDRRDIWVMREPIVACVDRRDIWVMREPRPPAPRGGMIVKLTGLQKKPMLNGCTALCFAYLEDRERFSVRMVGEEGTLLVKAENLTVHDTLRTAVESTPLGEINECNLLAPAMLSQFGWTYGRPQDVREFSQNPKLDRSVYWFVVHAVGHKFLLDVIRCKDGAVFSRVFQAYKAGPREGSGFSATAWLEKQTWMDSKALRQFFLELERLRRAIDKLVAEMLEEFDSERRPTGVSLVEHGRNEACRMIESSTHGQCGGKFIMGMEPGQWWDQEAIKAYVEDHKAQGFDVTQGCLTMRNSAVPNSTVPSLWYNLQAWLDIMAQQMSVFHGENHHFTLCALKNQGYGYGWNWTEIRHTLPHPLYE